MLTYVQYLWDRYVGEKGQGMTEYAVIVLIVVGVAAAVYGSSSSGGLYSAINSIFTKITTAIEAIGK